MERDYYYDLDKNQFKSRTARQASGQKSSLKNLSFGCLRF